MEKELRDFIERHLRQVKPLSKQAALAYFNASVTGDKKEYDRAARLEMDLNTIYSDKKSFELLKKIANVGDAGNPFLKRQLDILYNQFLGKQIDPEKLEAMVRISNHAEQTFAAFRAKIDGEELTDNRIDEILRTETDSEKLEQVWKASKEVGGEVEDDVLQLVKLRNEAAVQLGFANFHEMQLLLAEQQPADIDKIFDDLERETRPAFAEVKREMDAHLSERYGIAQDRLMPWHYQNRFFQEPPEIYELDLNRYYSGKDIVETTREFFAGIGLPIDEMLQRSDLFEKPGKYQHAYCTDIDREGDVRVVCNIKPNHQWAGTMLHEFGHAVYDRYTDYKLPWLLRGYAHVFTTEAVAMLFGRLAGDPQWMRSMNIISDNDLGKIEPVAAKRMRLQMLVFSRWVQVVYRFEKAMYANPDRDLNKLWWDLVEKYQLLRRPPQRNAPDWAAKIHLALYPVYYHNYLLGELFASQLYIHIKQHVLRKSPSFTGQPAVGEFLKNRIFEPGNRWPWPQLIRFATGEDLNPGYFARQFIKA